MIEKKRKIIIFTCHSKKIGLGHFVRSQRLYHELKKNFKCEFYVNKNKDFIKKQLNKQNNFALIIFDFKKYDKFFLKYKKNLHFILFDQNKIKKKNIISFNPLNLKKNGNFNGPKWFAFPNNFFKKKNKKFFKKKFNIFISQGGTDSNKNLKKIINSINLNNPKIDRVFVKVPRLRYLENNNKKIINLFNINNLFNILNKTDIAISGCGNFSFEINFFKIPTIYISNEQDEIKRGKLLESKGIGNFYKINNLNKMITELNLIMDNKNYYEKMVSKRGNYFQQNGLANIKKKINKIFKNNEIK
jgi:spore coat polysaccharide biosynthesis predicted glycosyltransferase SpsG